MRTFGDASLIGRSSASSLPSVDSELMSPLVCDLLLGFETQDKLSFETEKAMCTRMRRGVTPVAPCQQRYRDVQGATHEVDRLRGDDFSEICSTEAIERAASPIIEEAMAVPGRAVALLVSGYMLPVDVRVRLFLDMGHNPGFTGMARILGTLLRWLSWPGGGNLILPDDPEIEYRDAILVGLRLVRPLRGRRVHTDLHAVRSHRMGRKARGALCGGRRLANAAGVSRGGSLRILPAGLAFPAGRGIRLDHDFAGGETVVIDYQGETLLINDVDTRDCVALASDFFALEPGDCIVSTSNCTHPVSSPRSTSVASTPRRSRTCSTRSRDART